MRRKKRLAALLLAAAILCAPTALAEEAIQITDAEDTEEIVVAEGENESAAASATEEINGTVEISADEIEAEPEEIPSLPLVAASATFTGKADPSETAGSISVQSTTKKNDIVPYRSNNKQSFPMYSDIKLNFTMVHYSTAPESRAVIRVYHSSGEEITDNVVKKSFKKKVTGNQKLVYTLKVGKSLTDTKTGVLPVGTYTVKCYTEYKSGKTWKKTAAHKFTFYVVPKMGSASAVTGGLKIKWNHAVALYKNEAGEQYLDIPEKYIVYRRVGTGKWKELTRGSIAADKSCSGVDINKLKNGTLYSYSIKAVYGGKVGQRSKSVSYYYLTAPTPKASRLSSNKVKLSWKRNTKASGYQIKYADNTAMKNAVTKTIKGSKSVSTTLTKLKKNVKYFTVRSYKTVKGKKYYSAWNGIEVA